MLYFIMNCGKFAQVCNIHALTSFLTDRFSVAIVDLVNIQIISISHNCFSGQNWFDIINFLFLFTLMDALLIAIFTLINAVLVANLSPDNYNL